MCTAGPEIFPMERLDGYISRNISGMYPGRIPENLLWMLDGGYRNLNTQHCDSGIQNKAVSARKEEHENLNHGVGEDCQCTLFVCEIMWHYIAYSDYWGAINYTQRHQIFNTAIVSHFVCRYHIQVREKIFFKSSPEAKKKETGNERLHRKRNGHVVVFDDKVTSYKLYLGMGVYIL